jgi:hypothetical protein
VNDSGRSQKMWLLLIVPATVIRAAANKAGQVAALKPYVIPRHTPLQEIAGGCSGARVWMGCPKSADHGATLFCNGPLPLALHRADGWSINVISGPSNELMPALYARRTMIATNTRTNTMGTNSERKMKRNRSFCLGAVSLCVRSAMIARTIINSVPNHYSRARIFQVAWRTPGKSARLATTASSSSGAIDWATSVATISALS